jgi:hypothetical protein
LRIQNLGPKTSLFAAELQNLSVIQIDAKKAAGPMNPRKQMKRLF